MGAEKGSAFLLKVGNGAEPPSAASNLASPAYLHPAADLQTDSVLGPVEVRISQIGAGAASHPARIFLG